MQPRQAQDIFKSLGFISVTHNGRQVYIEQVDGDYAQVEYTQTGNKARVPVSELEAGESAF